MIRSYFVLTILAGAILAASTAPLAAENCGLQKMYGNGVHAFFSHDYVKAHDCLNKIIDSDGGKDPRCYYFRGLAYLKLGREPEARADFAKGAELETVDSQKFYNVSKALERIQGDSRVIIEEYRAKARVAAAAEAEKFRHARYEDLRAAEARILQEQAQAAPTSAAPLQPAKTSDPFTAGPIEDETPKPAAEKAAAQPADPFAVAPAQTAAQPAAPGAAPPATKQVGGILGSLGKAVGKTAQGAAGGLPGVRGKGPGEAAPLPESKPAAADDPFAKPSPALQPKQPAPKAPAGKEQKPPASKGEQPADPDDPFA
jgi:hypothetical protein